MTYTWVGFPHRPIGGGAGTRVETLDLISNIVFALLTMILIMLAARIVRGHPGVQR